MSEEELLNGARNSYIKKDRFIEMLSNLEFTEVKCADIDLITGYRVKDGAVEPFSYNIKIE